MKKSQAYPSSYLSQEDVKPAPIRATIEDVRIETVGKEDPPAEKPVMHFREEGLKPFVLNQTNWQTIEEAYGEESDAWRGKPIELYHDPGVMFGREKVGGVRVRIPSGTEPLGLAEAAAEALKLGKTKDDLVAALKARGLKGYSPAKDSAVARAVLASWEEERAVDETVPF